MKKSLFLGIFAVIGIMAAITLIKLNGIDSNELLNANVEALAWDNSEGGDGKVDCMMGKTGCTFKVILHDDNGNEAVDPEGNPLYIKAEIPYMKNMSSKAQ